MIENLRDGKMYNLYEQDFKDVRAYATTFAGELFFGNIVGGIVPRLAGGYTEENRTIVIGKFKKEYQGIIDLEDALTISPVGIRNAQNELNYSALDCLRALHFEVRTLYPETLTKLSLKRKDIKKELNLDN